MSLRHTIKVSDDNYRRIINLKAKAEADSGEVIYINDVVGLMLTEAEAHTKEGHKWLWPK